MAIIEHCRQRQRAVSVYRAQKYKQWETLFICEGFCKVCGKPFFNTVGFDIWGKRSPETGTFLVDRKLYYSYLDLIRQGTANKIDPKLMNQRSTKASAAGVGQWTMLSKLPTEQVFKKILIRPLFTRLVVLGKTKFSSPNTPQRPSVSSS